MSRVLVNHDKPSGLKTWAHFNGDGDLEALQYSQEVEDVVRWCHEAQDEPNNGDFRHLGRYPVGELILFGKVNGINDPEWYLKPEYSDLWDRLVNGGTHDRLRVWRGRY